MEELDYLEKFNCSGNTSLKRIPNLGDLIIENDELHDLELDMNLFPDAISFSNASGFYDTEAAERLSKIEKTSKAVFVDSMLKKDVNITYSKMMQFHQKAMKILIENSIDRNDENVIQNIEKYIKNNTEFSDDYQNYSEKRASVGARSNSNGAYNVLMSERGNTEGYAKAMQYLLKLKGINSQMVYCVDKNETEPEKYNSVLVLDDGENYIDLGERKNLGIKTKEQMETDYQFDCVHLANEVTNNALRVLGARRGKVEELEQTFEKDIKSKTKEKEEEVDYGRERGPKESIY